MKWLTLALVFLFAAASCTSTCGPGGRKPPPLCLDGVCVAESGVLHVVGQAGVLNWTPIGAATHWQCVNSGVLTPSDSSYLRARGYTGFDPFLDDLVMAAPPADLDTLTGIKVRMRARWDTTLNFADHVAYFNFLGSSGGAQMGYTDAIDLETQSSGAVHNYPPQAGDPGYVAGQEWINVTMLGTFPKSVVNTAWCEVGAIIDGAAPDSTDIIRCIEIDVVYVYTPVAPAAGGGPAKMHIGVGFGPGFRR